MFIDITLHRVKILCKSKNKDYYGQNIKLLLFNQKSDFLTKTSDKKDFIHSY